MTCLMCGGIAYLLGTLGKLNWFRCENCGMEQCQEVTEEDSCNL